MKIQKLRLSYPGIDLTGLINIIFEKELPNIIKKGVHKKIVGTKDYNDIPVDSWEIEYRKLNIATSHAPSRIKAQKYLRKYSKDFRSITFDAHLDIGKSDLIHAAWLTEDLAKQTAVIGGWSEASVDLANGKTMIPFISSNTNELFDKKNFVEWISGKKVYLTIDLDFFPSQDNYMGLSSYWHRNMFIGHAMNIKQKIEMKEDVEIGLKDELVGIQLHIFKDLISFIKQKEESIQSQIHTINCLVEDILVFIQGNSASLLSLDLVEYSPICDWQNLTIKSIEENFDFLNSLISTITE